MQTEGNLNVRFITKGLILEVKGNIAHCFIFFCKNKPLQNIFILER